MLINLEKWPCENIVIAGLVRYPGHKQGVYSANRFN